MMEPRPCPVCGAADIEILYQNSFVGIFDEEIQIKLGCCQVCGMIYVPSFLSDEDLENYYSNHSAYEYPENNYDPPESVRLKDFRQYNLLQKYVADDSVVLDIGCSQGHLLSLFKALNVDLIGIEPSPALRDIAKMKYGIEVLTGFLDDHLELSGSLSVIILSHVLEHLRNPRQVIDSLLPKLGSQGVVYVEVPIIEKFDERDLFQISFEHINYFSQRSLSNLMHQAGFEEVEHVFFENDNGAAPCYPTLGTVWSKSDFRKPIASTYLIDRKTIKRYIELTSEHTNVLNKRIAETLRVHGRVGIWGAGTLTAQLLAQTPLGLSGSVAVVYDNDPKKDGMNMSGIPIRKPDLAGDFMGEDGVEAIVIGSWSSQNEIFQQLSASGVEPRRLVRLFAH